MCEKVSVVVSVDREEVKESRVGWPVDSDVIYLVCDQRSASKVRPDLWLHLVGISWLDQGEMERGATER